MRVLVTGGTGGLGREIALSAERAGHTVRVASRRAAPAEPGIGREWTRMDLASGEGVAAGVAGVDAIVHAASDPRRPREVDVEGTRRLVEAARAARVPHLVYVSIVGVDRIPYAYYRAKLEAERIVAEGGVPFSILRATQFHSFIDMLIAAAARVALAIPLPTSFKVQSVDSGEVADRLVRALDAGPGSRLRDFGGPEMLTLGQMVAAWKRARGVRKPVLPLPLPGARAAAYRQGRNTAPEGERGTLRWEEWLQR